METLVDAAQVEAMVGKVNTGLPNRSAVHLAVSSALSTPYGKDHIRFPHRRLDKQRFHIFIAGLLAKDKSASQSKAAPVPNFGLGLCRAVSPPIITALRPYGLQISSIF